MSMHNWSLMKQNRNERLISINQNDIHTIYDWYDKFELLDPTAKNNQTYKATLLRLEQGPITKTIRCEIWCVSSDLTSIAMWYKYLKNPSENDKSVYSIIDQAINPNDPTKVAPAPVGVSATEETPSEAPEVKESDKE